MALIPEPDRASSAAADDHRRVRPGRWSAALGWLLVLAVAGAGLLGAAALARHTIVTTHR